MIDSFKNFERLRYRLSNDMREIASCTSGNADDVKGQISNTIFATIFSAFITEIALKDNGNEYNICMLVFQIFIFCIVYIVSYIAYNYLYNIISSARKKRKVNKLDTSTTKMIQIQKDFDNIACDSILVAKSYIDAFNSLSNNASTQSLKTFYFYEVMHYLDTASEKTKELVEFKNECIRTLQTASGVDIYRVVNLKNIMREINMFLNNELNNICNGNPDKQAIQYQYNQIKDKLNYIEDNL